MPTTGGGAGPSAPGMGTMGAALSQSNSITINLPAGADGKKISGEINGALEKFWSNKMRELQSGLGVK